MGSKDKSNPQETPAEEAVNEVPAAAANEAGTASKEKGNTAEVASAENAPVDPVAESDKNAGTDSDAKSQEKAVGEKAAPAEVSCEKGGDEEDNDSIDWLTIVLMIAVMANIAYWIWVRDNSITGDVEMHRPPGVTSAMQTEGNGPPPGPNEGQDSFGNEVNQLAGIRGDDPEQDKVRTYIVIANALEIAGICDVHTVWDLDKQVLEASSANDGGTKEKELVQAAYDESIKLMRESYSRVFNDELSKASPAAQEAANKIFKEAEALCDTKPLDAMARYEDAMLRLRAAEVFENNPDNNNAPGGPGNPPPGDPNAPAPGPGGPPPGDSNAPGGPGNPPPGDPNAPAPGPGGPPPQQ